MFDVTHGAGLTAIWTSWARYCMDDCLDRFVKFAKNVMGVQDTGSDEGIAEKGICRMEEFYHRIGMPVNMTELGIHPTDEQIKEMAEQTIKAAGGKQGSAKVLYTEDIIKIFNRAR